MEDRRNLDPAPPARGPAAAAALPPEAELGETGHCSRHCYSVDAEARRYGLRLLVTPDTIVRWHRDIVRRRWVARSMHSKALAGHRRNIKALILRLARSMPNGATAVRGTGRPGSQGRCVDPSGRSSRPTALMPAPRQPGQAPGSPGALLHRGPLGPRMPLIAARGPSKPLGQFRSSAEAPVFPAGRDGCLVRWQVACARCVRLPRAALGALVVDQVVRRGQPCP